jgi:hypothetical protein
LSVVVSHPNYSEILYSPKELRRKLAFFNIAMEMESRVNQQLPLLALQDPMNSDLETESEEDLASLDTAAFSQAVVFATDWTAETILRQLEKGNISLDPGYQRRDAWRPERKSRFIESLLLGLPIPQIVLVS